MANYFPANANTVPGGAKKSICSPTNIRSNSSGATLPFTRGKCTGCGSLVHLNKPLGLPPAAAELDSPLENHPSASLTRNQVGMSERSRADLGKSHCRDAASWLSSSAFVGQTVSRHRQAMGISHFQVNRLDICAHYPATLVYEVRLR